MSLSPAERIQLLTRLKRAEGQIAAVRRMVSKEGSWVDMLVLIQAARGALAKAAQVLLRPHVETCVTAAIERGGPEERSEKISEVMDVFGRYAGLGAT